MNMEDQFQNYINQHATPPPPLFSGGTSAARPSSLNFARGGGSGDSVVTATGANSKAPSILRQIYKYVKWFTIVIIAGVIIYFLHNLTRQYLFPKPTVCSLNNAPNQQQLVEEAPAHEGQPPLPNDIDLKNEYENNTYEVTKPSSVPAPVTPPPPPGSEENFVPVEDNSHFDENSNNQEKDNEDTNDENFTSLNKLSNA